MADKSIPRRQFLKAAGAVGTAVAAAALNTTVGTSAEAQSAQSTRGAARGLEQIDKIGFLYSGSKPSLRKQFRAFHQGLLRTGIVEGENVDIKYRSAEDIYDDLDQHIDDFKNLGVRVIVAAGGSISAKKAHDKVPEIPIVFTAVTDPVSLGLVSDLSHFSHPDENATGTAALTSELDAKRLELLTQLLRKVDTIGALINPNRPNAVTHTDELKVAANAMQVRLVPQYAATVGALGDAFKGFLREKVQALLVTADPLFNSRRRQVLNHAGTLNKPAIYQWREFVEDGGLMSYGTSITDAYERAGRYAELILGGKMPADLPIVQPDPDTLMPVINFKTAVDLPLDIPYSLLGRSEIINEGT